jgi:hypothetical protein
MTKYYTMEEEVIYNKDGELRKVIDFRKRTRYTDEDRLTRAVLPDEILRLDLIAKRVFNNEFDIEHLVDANDTDLLSISQNDQMFFPNPTLVVR